MHSRVRCACSVHNAPGVGYPRKSPRTQPSAFRHGLQARPLVAAMMHAHRQCTCKGNTNKAEFVHEVSQSVRTTCRRLSMQPATTLASPATPLYATLRHFTPRRATPLTRSSAL